MNTQNIANLIDAIESLYKDIVKTHEEDWLAFASLTNTLARNINLAVTIPDAFTGDWATFYGHPVAKDSKRVVAAARRLLMTVSSEGSGEDSGEELAVLKQILARTLGEVYRIQQHLGVNTPVSDGVVYGLLNGVEDAVLRILQKDPLTKAESDAAEEFLDKKFYRDSDSMANLKGFYDIEQDLAGLGVDRSKAIALFTYVYNDHRFGEIVEKLNSGYSPVECKTFELSDCDMGYKEE
jgi:hypothetical protein